MTQNRKGRKHMPLSDRRNRTGSGMLPYGSRFFAERARCRNCLRQCGRKYGKRQAQLQADRQVKRQADRRGQKKNGQMEDRREYEKYAEGAGGVCL